ncbi:MAG: alpha/beta hydrolase fold domain-containing protein [Firmicutes bacterium]|nr:alpha/beta hydrolase fold domain-containing protein [Bacillota bacterium]
MKLEHPIGEHKCHIPERVCDWDACGIDFYEDIPFGIGGGRELCLDLMVSRDNDNPTSPCLIWVHGGAWSSEYLNKKHRPTEALVDFCHEGFVVVSIDYRLIQESPWPGPIEDCKCAVRYLKSHAELLGIDPDRIGIWGESAGGQLSALVGASYNNKRLEGIGGWGEYSSSVAAVCDFYCGGDMTHMGASSYDFVRKRADELGIKLTYVPHLGVRPDPEHEKSLFGTVGEAAAQIGMDISPIFYVKEDLPPYLLMHGDEDKFVPVDFSNNFYDALYKYGHDVTYVLVHGQGHGLFRGRGYYDIVLGFMKRHLTGEKIKKEERMRPLKPLPANYLRPTNGGGRVVKLEYDTNTYDENSVPLHKFCYVYLPEGYSEEKRYNILYAVHGGEGNIEAYLGNCEKTSPIKIALDNMIANGDIEPLIVVSPTYYNQTSMAGNFEGATDVINNFHNELSRDLIPAVESKFSTYAESVTPEGIEKSRRHRAVTGFSMGSLATWVTFLNNLSEFAYFVPTSGDLWVNGAKDRGNPGNAKAAAEVLNENAAKHGYGNDDFFIYALTGDKDIAYHPMKELIDELRASAGNFTFTDDSTEPGNIRWRVEPGAHHSYEFVPLYFYNALPELFRG